MVRIGGFTTVKVTGLLVIEPPELLTITQLVPESKAVTLLMVSVAVAEPEMLPPADRLFELNCH